MRAGRLRHRVTIQRPESYRDPVGQVINQWVDVATVRAEVNMISGKERMASGQLFSEASVRIWLRYRPDVTAKNRIVCSQLGTSSDTFYIVAAIPNAKRTRLELLCQGGLPK